MGEGNISPNHLKVLVEVCEFHPISPEFCKRRDIKETEMSKAVLKAGIQHQDASGASALGFEMVWKLQFAFKDDQKNREMREVRVYSG